MLFNGSLGLFEPAFNHSVLLQLSHFVMCLYSGLNLTLTLWVNFPSFGWGLKGLVVLFYLLIHFIYQTYERGSTRVFTYKVFGNRGWQRIKVHGKRTHNAYFRKDRWLSLLLLSGLFGWFAARLVRLGLDWALTLIAWVRFNHILVWLLSGRNL